MGYRLAMSRSFTLALSPLLVTVVLSAGGARAEDAPVPPRRPAWVDLPAPVATPSLDAALPGRTRYQTMIEAEASRQGLPSAIADAVMRIESGYRPGMIGRDGERGLMQVMPPTAAMLGFRGTPEELAEPETNIRLGVRYLAGAWRLSGGDLCRALMKYRAGHRQEKMSALSVEYCRRARVHLASLGSPLAAGMLPPITVVPKVQAWLGGDTGLVRRGRRRVVADSGGFWAAHRARVAAIESRLRARHGGRRLAAN